MHVVLVTKSNAGVELRLYDESLSPIESEKFNDLYSLNFHLQTFAKKQGFPKSLIVIHDVDKNSVDLSLVEGENSFFVD